jgi:hypothetical protein
MARAKVVIHPEMNAFYYSFYLEGLREVFGTRALEFSRRIFPISARSLAFTVPRTGWKVYVDAEDKTPYDLQALEWCDVYGKTNIDIARPAPRHAHKVVPIGPSFGVNIWSLPATCWFAAKHAALMRKDTGKRPGREFLANYWRQWKYRVPLATYIPGESRRDYVFFLSSLWKSDDACNRYRANFLEACRAIPELHVEGGFTPRVRHDVPGFDAFAVARRYTLRDYLCNVKQSLVSFNTPAVAGCHGWKLAEFLALGKAIISTPLTRALPAPLTHGTHLHIVDGSAAAIRDAVEHIRRDDAYRQRLETNARRYYLEHLKPSRTIDRLLSAIECIEHQIGTQAPRLG